MNKGVKTVADLERARAKKRAVLDQLENAEMMRRSIQILLGRTLERAKCKALTFDVDELEDFDPDRVVLVDLAKGYGKVIVGIKDNASDEFSLDFLSKRALKSVEAPANEPANDNDQTATSGITLTCSKCGEKSGPYMVGSPLPALCVCGGENA